MTGSGISQTIADTHTRVPVDSHVFVCRKEWGERKKERERGMSCAVSVKNRAGHISMEPVSSGSFERHRPITICVTPNSNSDNAMCVFATVDTPSSLLFHLSWCACACAYWCHDKSWKWHTSSFRISVGSKPRSVRMLPGGDLLFSLPSAPKAYQHTVASPTASKLAPAA